MSVISITSLDWPDFQWFERFAEIRTIFRSHTQTQKILFLLLYILNFRNQAMNYKLSFQHPIIPCFWWFQTSVGFTSCQRFLYLLIVSIYITQFQWFTLWHSHICSIYFLQNSYLQLKYIIKLNFCVAKVFHSIHQSANVNVNTMPPCYSFPSHYKLIWMEITVSLRV